MDKWEDDGDWELINDDGFVYKRKKRPCTTATTATSASAPILPDPAVEEKNLRQRKKSALLKLRDSYREEILQWEHLSNTLSEKHEQALITQPQKPQDYSTPLSSVLSAESKVSPSQRLVDELLSQAEAQEAIINDISNLCDIVEALCNAREEKFKQSFTELPIWESSPRKIISSLCDE